MSELSPSRIVCAACKLPNGLILTGARHWDMVMHNVAEKLNLSREDYAYAEQGFIDQHGTFLSREGARVLAVRNEQIRGEPTHPTSLFSEDLY